MKQIFALIIIVIFTLKIKAQEPFVVLEGNIQNHNDKCFWIFINVRWKNNGTWTMQHEAKQF